jgi:glycosyltransferase involved in cell wall biosynthesis
VRIAVISSSFPRFRGDGVGSFIYSLTRSLVRLGHDVTVLAPHDPAVVPDWQSEVAVRRVRFIWTDSWSRLGHARSLASDVHLKWHAYPLVALFSFFSIVQLSAEIRRHGADIIHAQWLIPGGFIGAVASWLTGVPLVISVHGSDVFVAERHRLFRPVTHLIVRTACHVIACSGDLASRVVVLGMPHERVTVIPYGVDVERYKPDPQLARTLRASLPVPDGQNVVMAMGRLVHKKGFSYLLRAAQPVLAQCPNTTFVLAGEGDLRAELEQLAQSLDVRQHVLFVGHIPWDQTPGYLAMADVLAVPSVIDEAGNVDGLPNVLLESMASGCAIVASNVAGIPEVIQDGENGLLVPQRDERALGKAICRLLQDPLLRQRLGHAARKSAGDLLDWQQIGERVVQVLQACVEEA